MWTFQVEICTLYWNLCTGQQWCIRCAAIRAGLADNGSPPCRLLDMPEIRSYSYARSFHTPSTGDLRHTLKYTQQETAQRIVYRRGGRHLRYLWPPYGIKQVITFLPCGFFYLLPSFFFRSFPRLISAVADWMYTILPRIVWPWREFKMQVWKWMCCTRLAGKSGPKNHKKSPSGHHSAILSGYIFATKACVDSRKNLLNSNISPTCLNNMLNFSPLTAEICSLVWGTPANFNGFRVLAALLHGTLVVAVSQTLQRWTEGATYIRQGGHHVGHWPTF